MARNLDRKTREAKLEAIRQQNAADARRARLLSLVAVGIVVVLVVAVVVAIVLASGGDDDSEVTFPEQTVLTTEGDPASGGFLVGEEGPVQLVVYEDFQCPACRAFEAESGALIAELAAGDRVSVVKRPISILDRVTGDAIYSTRSAAAAACVGSTGDDEAYAAFTEFLFAEQPDEASAGGGLSDERLTELAEAAGADVADCIAEGTYLSWAAATTEAAGRELERLSTPTVVVDGEVVTGAQGGFPSSAELEAAIGEALGGQVDPGGESTDGTDG
jgi:protein-disulfide isomerase